MNYLKIFKYIILMNLVLVLFFIIFVLISNYIIKKDLRENYQEDDSWISLEDMMDKKDISEVIQRSNNPNHCNELESREMIEMCKKIISTKKPQVVMSLEECDYIIEEPERRRCRIMFEYRQALLKKDIPECNDAINEISCKEGFFAVTQFVSEYYKE